MAPNVATTLFAKCSSTPTSYAWNKPSDGPALPGGASTLNSFALTFPTAGAYTYSLAGTNASGQGPVSNQLTILVGDDNAKPACTVTASPIILTQNSNSKIQVACNPLPTSGGYVWAAADAGAPAMTAGSAFGELTFANAGTFTYKVQGVNGNGTGPMAGTIVTVLGVASNPTVTKAFSPASVNPNVNSTLTITLANGNAFAITGAAFSDTYPSGLVNASVPSSGTTCSGGTVTATTGGSGVSLSGATIPASGSCTVHVSVSSAAVGSYANTIAVGALTTANAGSNVTAATGTLTVTTASPPSFAQGSFESPVLAAGTYSYPTLTTPGWTPYNGPSTFTSTVTSGYLQAQGWAGAPDGAQAAMYPGDGGLRQSVTISGTGTYNISFSAMAHTMNPSIVARVLMDGVQVGSTLPLATATFSPFTITFQVNTAGTHLFDFTAVSPGGYIFIDNIRFTP